MKTLDEVIKAMDWCTDLDQSGCDACPYADSEHIQCFKEDALHYLKEYKDYTDTLSALPDYYEWLHSADNPPLTWDELRQMEGKPVWLEHKLVHGWRLVGHQENDHMMILVGAYTEQIPLFADDIGKTWQAYRKERE